MSTQLNPRRGYGTGAGRRKRPVTKQSMYFENDTWEATKILSIKLQRSQSDILRQSMRIGLDIIKASLAKGYKVTIDNSIPVAKHSFFFDDASWWESLKLANQLHVTHTALIQHSIRIGLANFSI